MTHNNIIMMRNNKEFKWAKTVKWFNDRGVNRWMCGRDGFADHLRKRESGGCRDSPRVCGGCCYKMSTDAAVGMTEGEMHTGTETMLTSPGSTPNEGDPMEDAGKRGGICQRRTSIPQKQRRNPTISTLLAR